MKSTSISTVVILILRYTNVSCEGNSSHTCGLDRAPVSVVYDGVAAIETYPWMGMLYYPTGNNLRFTTSVVLVTRQMVIATASEIDKLPKKHFRSIARVALGAKCDTDGIKVRDYSFHPEYQQYSTSALAMVQLETDHLKTELRPICQPPAYFKIPRFYAMTVVGNCKIPKIRIHKMQYIDNDKCQDFYRRTELDQNSLWPVHAACARAFSGGKCVWRSGVVLAVKQDGRWRLLGFSIYGPGCGAPARFLHYGMYHEWVRRSSTNIGQPAITRVADNHIIMRRSLANVQRYGPCDPEEKAVELYTDNTTILYRPGVYHAKYNMTLYANVEYSCITFEAKSLGWEQYEAHGVSPQPPNQIRGKLYRKTPRISLKRWCATSTGMCHDFQHLQIDFYVDIMFSQSVEFKVGMYGAEGKIISAAAALRLANRQKGGWARIPSQTFSFKF